LTLYEARDEFLIPIRYHSRDVRVMFIPFSQRASVAVFLALMKLFFGCTLRERVATTGLISLSGYILRIGFPTKKASDGDGGHERIRCMNWL